MPCCFSHTGSLHGPQGSVAVTDVEECCPRRCTTVPEALGIYARNTRLTVPVFSGISAHVHGGMFFSLFYAICKRLRVYTLHNSKKAVTAD